MPMVPHVTDSLLARLRASGLQTPVAGKACFDLKIGVRERESVNRWLAGLPDDGGRKWVAVGPWSKMAVKIWPYDKVYNGL